MDELLHKTRKRLQNPYAFLGDEGYEYSHPKTNISSTAPTKTPKISASRELLQQPYAYLDGDGGFSASTPPGTIILKEPLIRKRKRYSDNDIEQIATNILREVYRKKDLLWESDAPESPFGLISPKVILEGIGYKVEAHESLDIANDVGSAEFSLAGIIDQDNKRVRISNNFPRQTRHFTLAHELGKLCITPVI